uniref:NADH dehydrogenase subunit 6 n=1 Tax=Nematodirus spathiger TaxID=61841 RepID=A0A075CFZ4_NEMSP|nr:NADH dehydrogenase subunit 6 [Nematodirus spathiger]AGZ64191.1 NADH dehydrogenase subunit 6 [Nematodirus spathiger]
MLGFFMFMSVLGGLMSYMNLDPMKSSFFLIVSVLMMMPMIACVSYVWYSYFISLLFLSGIFVILVYFSSLSSFVNVKMYYMILLFIATSLFYVIGLSMFGVNYVGMNFFYYNISLYILLWLIILLLLFMNFCSYFLSFSGALRSV